MNSLPKYVVTKTLERLDWENSHVLDGDVAEEVCTLKGQPGNGGVPGEWELFDASTG
jgi:hypothetical protein